MRAAAATVVLALAGCTGGVPGGDDGDDGAADGPPGTTDDGAGAADAAPGGLVPGTLR
jgi:hypothetical protein